VNILVRDFSANKGPRYFHTDSFILLLLLLLVVVVVVVVVSLTLV